MLVLTRKREEVIMIGDDIEIIVTEIGDDKVKIGINAPKHLKIFRKELIKEVSNTNVESSIKDKQLVDKAKELLEKRHI